MTLTKQERIKRRENTRLLYSLERKWGVVVDVYQLQVGAPNYETGVAAPTTVKVQIPKFITFSVQYDNKFEYDLSFLAANKNFTYGGVYTPGTRIGLFRNVAGITLTMSDFVIYQGKKYEMVKFDELDYRLGWILVMKHTPGTKPRQIHDRVVLSRVDLNQDVGVE